MDDVGTFRWLRADDRRTLRALDGPITNQPPQRAAESLVTRTLVFISAPAWLGATVALLLARCVTARGFARPTLVLHQRVGFKNRLVWIPKIPTMLVPQNRSAWGGLVALASGPPVEGTISTPLDSWLRRSGLDELPQLVLVATGRMRLVGPRPVTPSELDEMRKAGTVAVDHVAPGILGVWQLLDRRAYSLVERQALDQWMLERWTPKLRRRIVATGLGQAFRRVIT